MRRLARFTGRPYQSPRAGQRVACGQAAACRAARRRRSRRALDQVEHASGQRVGVGRHEHRGVADRLDQPHRRLDRVAPPVARSAPPPRRAPRAARCSPRLVKPTRSAKPTAAAWRAGQARRSAARPGRPPPAGPARACAGRSMWPAPGPPAAPAPASPRRSAAARSRSVSPGSQQRLAEGGRPRLAALAAWPGSCTRVISRKSSVRQAGVQETTRLAGRAARSSSVEDALSRTRGRDAEGPSARSSRTSSSSRLARPPPPACSAGPRHPARVPRAAAASRSSRLARRSSSQPDALVLERCAAARAEPRRARSSWALVQQPLRLEVDRHGAHRHSRAPPAAARDGRGAVRPSA